MRNKNYIRLFKPSVGNEELNSMFNKEVDEYLKEVEQNQLNEIDQKGL